MEVFSRSITVSKLFFLNERMEVDLEKNEGWGGVGVRVKVRVRDRRRLIIRKQSLTISTDKRVKTSQDKSRQDKTRQDKTRQDKTR